MKKNYKPKAILFDVGGVLIDVKPRQEGFLDVARIVNAFLIRTSGTCLGEKRILIDLEAAAAAYSSWKFAQSRRARPREITHREFWEDFVASDWPVEAQRAVAAHASDLSWKYDEATMECAPMEGALTVLKTIKTAGLKIGTVSNSLVGSLTRSYMCEYGFADYIDIQLYSDEVGLRKPNPEIIFRAAISLCVNLQKIWYLGDRLDRDVLAGRRAGVGKVILMSNTYQEDGPMIAAQADEIITKLTDLLAILPSL